MNRTHLPVVVLLLALALAGCGGAGEPVVDDGGAALEDVEVGDDDEATAPQDDASPSVATPSPSAAPSPTASASPGAPTFDEVCAGRDDEAFIEVLSPSPDVVVADPVTVEGCGNTFEATFIYEVATPDGAVLVGDFGTMSCGNGCVGEFEVQVEVGTTGPVVLTVFETDARDGSRQHVVEVPLTIE